MTLARVLAAALGCAAISAGAPATATVYLSQTDGKWQVVFNVIDKAKGVAWGTFVDADFTSSAFGSLSVATNAAFNDTTQMFGAGYVEAALTQQRIYQQSKNFGQWLLSNWQNNTMPSVYPQWFATQEAWARSQIASNSSRLWQAAGALFAQFDGLVAGYAAVAPADQALTFFDLQTINAAGDWLDLIPALQPGNEAYDWDHMNTSAVMDRFRKTTHCSGLIRVTGNFSDIFFGHSSWFIYQGTLRIYKHYSLALHDVPDVASRTMSFSSYPGYLSSLDDFYNMWDSGVVMIETSNSIMNNTLYDLVVPQSLLAWQRVRLSNMLAHNGSEWSDVFSQYNSGTYNNEYMVLSGLNEWTPGSPLRDNMLWIVEQIPGLVVGGDATQELTRGYFPSYNVPYWPAIYEASGYPAMVAKHARPDAPLASQEIAGLDYQLAPRAQIFRRDAGRVASFDDFLAIMRYNDYTRDPYAHSAWDAICSRGDLAGSGPNGCYDTKASSWSNWAARTAMAINGPTTSNGLPPFDWSNFPGYSILGLPTVYNFTFEATTPAW